MHLPQGTASQGMSNGVFNSVMRQPKITATRLLVLLSLLGSCQACAPLDVGNPFENFVLPEFDNKVHQPERVTAIWTNTVLNQEGKVGVRGFGGRLMFYGPKRERPIKVEGKLTVYAYDDTGRDPTNCVPDKKFIFRADQLVEHYSKSQLGHSYSFWVPWDEIGGLQRKITLVCRFESKGGGIVVSEMSSQVLPGRLPHDHDESVAGHDHGDSEGHDHGANRHHSHAPKTADGGVRQVSYSEPVRQTNVAPAGSGAGNGVRKMTTDTISVPPRFLGWKGGHDPGAAAPGANWSDMRHQQNNTVIQRETSNGWAPLPAGELPPGYLPEFNQQSATGAIGSAHSSVAITESVEQPVHESSTMPGVLETRIGAEAPPPMGWTTPSTAGQPPRGLGGPSLQLQPRPTRSVPYRSPARGRPAQPPGSSRALMRPRPAGWPSDPSSSPELSPAASPTAALNAVPSAG